MLRLSVCLSVDLCMYVYMYACIYVIWLTVCLSVCLSVYRSVSMCVHLSLSFLSICIHDCMYMYMYCLPYTNCISLLLIPLNSKISFPSSILSLSNPFFFSSIGIVPQNSLYFCKAKWLLKSSFFIPNLVIDFCTSSVAHIANVKIPFLLAS